MRLMLPILGILVAAIFGDSTNRGFDVVAGALIGFVLAEVLILRADLLSFRKTLEHLTAELRGRTATPTAPAVDPQTFPTPEPPAEVHEQTVPSDSVPFDLARRPWQEFEEPAPVSPPQPDVAPRPRHASIAQSYPESPIVHAIRRFFTGGNTLVRVGVIVLFFGVAFLLRYLAEHTYIPIEVRLIGVALAGMALIIVGWRLRLRRLGYALSLQGGGVGILYLIVFAALRLYKILPAELAFPLLVAIAALSALLAIWQNSLWFALLAVSGGFLAPVLASTGQGSHVVLFSYYAVLNAGILAVAWFKAWRPLNVVGFVFTFAIGTAWGVLKYNPQDFATTEPFLILFFLFYWGISILFTLRQPVKLTGYIDATLIFGTPIVVFSLQAALLHDRLLPLAFSAVALSALYLATATVLNHWRRDTQALLIESFLSIGVAFLTLAIPLSLDARWNAAMWALEGTALVWIGCRQNRLLPRAFGALLSLIAGCAVLQQFDHVSSALSLGEYIGIVVQSAAALFAARVLRAHRSKGVELEFYVPDALYCLGVALWLMGSASEIHSHLASIKLAAALVLLSVTTLASAEFFKRVPLGAARLIALLQLPAMLGMAAWIGINDTHPFNHRGWWAWPIAFAALVRVMVLLEGPARAALANLLNAGASGLFCLLLSWEIAWEVAAHLSAADTWRAAAWAVIPAALLWWLPRLVTRVQWPFAKNRAAYLFIVGVGIAGVLSIWSFVTNITSAGDTAPLPYVPVFNPLDLAQIGVLLVLLRYWQFLKSVSSPGFARLDKRVPPAVLAVLSFIALNAVLLRSLHQWWGVGLELNQLMASTLVQTSITLFWTVLALLTMLFATRKGSRVIWLIGAVLLGVVIAKLFLIDLSRIGSIERIISFVGVGLLMLVLGYLSPLPPAAKSPL
jgi:uncharacterized membrane protein